MSKLVQPLDFKAHRRLEHSLGYRGESRWIAWHWEPEINQVTYHDGKQVGTGAGIAWQIFLEHSQVQPFVTAYRLGETEEYWLLLDRQTRNVYVGEGKVIQNLLEEPESLTLLACLDNQPQGWQVFTDALQETWESWQNSTVTRHLKTALPVGVAGTLIAALSVGGWLWLKPTLQLRSMRSQPTTTVITEQPQSTCGLSGSDDFSSYRVTAQGKRELHLIAVYEARSDHRGNHHPTGTITVTVEPQAKPIVLALSAYEPVAWQIYLEPGAIVEKIILNGYYQQTVVGVTGVPVLDYSDQGTGQALGISAYRWGNDPDSGTDQLVPQLEKLAGVSLTSFQGCYRGTDFRVPGSI